MSRMIGTVHWARWDEERYTTKQLAGQATRRRSAIDARLKLCRKLGMEQDTPIGVLLDKAEEELTVWERSELEAEL